MWQAWWATSGMCVAKIGSLLLLWGRVLPGGGGLNDGRQPPAQSNVKILENWVENLYLESAKKDEDN